MDNVYNILSRLHIEYEKYDHPAVFTVEEASKFDRGIDAGKSKNLFLKNKKGNKHFLLILESKKSADLKKLGTILNENKMGLLLPNG